MSIVLIGPPAAGKSRVGKRLAARLGRDFIDTDKLIVAEHGPIAHLFGQHGEAHFRRLEREAVQRALAAEAVIAFGGGAVLHPETQADLAHASVVLLTVNADAVVGRIGNGKRPLVTSIEAWQALADARRPLYTSLADYVTDTSGRPLAEVVDEIVQWIQEKQ